MNLSEILRELKVGTHLNWTVFSHEKAHRFAFVEIAFMNNFEKISDTPMRLNFKVDTIMVVEIGDNWNFDIGGFEGLKLPTEIKFLLRNHHFGIVDKPVLYVEQFCAELEYHNFGYLI